MFCSKCGKEMDNNSKFCPQCGATTAQPYGEAAANQQTEELERKPMYSQAVSSSDTQVKQVKPVKTKKPKKKMSKGKKTVITLSVVIGVMLALAVTLFCVLITTPAFGVYREFRRENYSDALSDYRGDVEDEFIQEIILDILLKGYDEKLFQKYQAGELKYVSVVEALETLDRMGVVGIEQKINNITMIENANSAMQQGNQYYANGDYENAIKKYTAIKESSDKYAEAQNMLNELYPKYIDAIVEKAKAYQSEQRFVDAIEYIDVSYALIPKGIDTAKLTQIRSETLYDYIVYIRDEVVKLVGEKQFMDAFALIDSAIAVDDNADFQNGKAMVETKYGEYTAQIAQKHLDNGDYTSAAKTLQDAMEVIPANTEILTLLAKVEKEYVKSVSATAQEHLSNEDYISAARVVKNALNVYPENADLKALKAKVEKATPIYLLSVCKPYATSSYTEYVNGELVRMGGDSYTDGFTLQYKGSYAIYNIDGAYKTLSFIVGHCDGTDMGDATIKVYCDGILKREIAMGAEDLPQKITLDITGVDQLKFELTTRWAVYAFANITVK